MSDSPQGSTGQKTVAIISKPGRPELSEVLPALEKWLRQRNYSLVFDEESTAYFPAPEVLARSEMGSRSPHLALVLGGVHGNEAVEQEKAELYQQIGKLQVELDWLQKKSWILRR